MIFIDSNVPMYLVGRSHPAKERLGQLMRELLNRKAKFVTSVEVYQEILHRYVSIGRWQAIDDAFYWLERVVDRTLTYDMTEIRLARQVLEKVEGLSARDALHVAVMKTAGIERIISMDRGFDLCPEIERLY